jgi:Bacterial type II/III secretion system short domain
MTARMLFVSLMALAATAAADQIPPEERPEATPPVQEDDRPLGAGMTIIRLKYAHAEELAATLGPILPEGVKVVPYPPVNALIITRQPAGLQPTGR